MGLPQFETIGDDFEAVVEHAAQIGMVMRPGGREGPDQLGVAFQGRSVQRGELPARQRGALPKMCSSSFCRRRVASSDAADLGPHQPLGDGAVLAVARRRPGPFSLEQGEHAGVPWRADREAFCLFEVGPFPLHPIPLPFRPFGLFKPFLVWRGLGCGSSVNVGTRTNGLRGDQALASAYAAGDAVFAR